MYRKIISSLIVFTFLAGSVSSALSPALTSGDMGSEEVKKEMYRDAHDRFLAGGGRKHIDKAWIRREQFSVRNLFTREGQNILRDLGIQNVINWQRDITREVIAKFFSGDKLVKLSDYGNKETEKFILKRLNKRPDIFKVNGLDIRFREADPRELPEGWENNKIYAKKDVVSALEYYRDNEARIPRELLDIKEGWFPVEEGNLPLGGIWKVAISDEDKKNLQKKYGIRHQEYKYVLVVHTKFAQMWKDIKKNDLLFNYVFMDKENKPAERTVSLAWSIFYRFAKHEMGDLVTPEDSVLGRVLPLFFNKNRFKPKGGAHLAMESDLKGLKEPVRDDFYSNLLGGRYNEVNDAVWIWFLHSYCYDNITRYSNMLFARRMEYVFKSREAIKDGLYLEFPNLWSDKSGKNKNIKVLWSDKVEEAINLARAINYAYFIERNVEAKEVELVSDKMANEYYVMEKDARTNKWKPLFAGGNKKEESSFSALNFSPDRGSELTERIGSELPPELTRYLLETAKLLKGREIEILVPKKISTGRVRSELDKINRRNRTGSGRKEIRYLTYDSEDATGESLKSKLSHKDLSVERIVLVDNQNKRTITDMLVKAPSLFFNERLLTVNIPDDYAKIPVEERVLQEKKTILLAVLTRLYKKGDTPNIGMLLRKMLYWYYTDNEEDIAVFMEKLSENDLDMDIVKRVKFFLKAFLKPFKLSEIMNDEFKMVDYFWTYA